MQFAVPGFLFLSSNSRVFMHALQNIRQHFSHLVAQSNDLLPSWGLLFDHPQLPKITLVIYLLTLSVHAREGYSSHFVCLSVCHFFILENAPFSGLKLTSVHSR